jgi:acetyl-CoA C-acetyltransferase
MSVYIIEAKRTPIGSLLGQFSSFSAIDLGVECLKKITNKNKVEEMIIGCVLSAGLGQSLCKQIAIKSGLSNINCVNVNKICGSGMKSLAMLVDSILLKNINCGIAGGVESMTNTPFLSKSRLEHKYGDSILYDSIILDGLKDPYTNLSMGELAEKIAFDKNITREMQDEYTIQSVLKTLNGLKNNIFEDEITPVNNIKTDEKPLKIKIDNIRSLKPIFSKTGTITAASSSSLSDGASIICLASEKYILKEKIIPLAKIISYSSYSGEPSLFASSPIYSIEKLLSDNNWSIDDIDLFEINEAFAIVPIIVMKHLNIPISKLNINGGLALGHPLGSSGCRIVVSLLYSLKLKKLKRGIAAICIGGGESMAIAIEIV